MAKNKVGKLLLNLFLTAIVSGLSLSISTGQDSVSTKFKYGIGGGAGFTTGYGLSFRYLPKRFGAQVNFAPFKSKETERYSVGVTFLYTLIENKISNLFLYQGNHYYFNSYTNYLYDPTNPFVNTPTRVTEDYMNNGLGFGIELTIAKRIGFNLMAGYAFYNTFKELNVTGETALFYKF